MNYWMNGTEPENSLMSNNKYHREIKPGVFVDVYDVLKAWDVRNPALQHLIKKALAVGQRGHKDAAEDLQDIVDSALRAWELDSSRKPETRRCANTYALTVKGKCPCCGRVVP
ncbi:hypothetical protein PF621_gp23 [Salmonella phage vB_SenTO17]|uniref:Uncharacterized protein n=1 Tax=Salmonella phage vB_SenTO17 TaxID=2732254 RepID=A0A7G3T5U3_9CAUD|nr:hypothetical protein PF621_gp23 [Salmonella phage vB_SenTO17]QJQ80406.1 hypothetical protein vBSenTO17_23 [Salmonella phage vB_SenTO17]